MSELPSPSSFRLSLLAEPALQLGLVLGAYLATALSIYVFYAIGSIPGVDLPWFGLVGFILVTLASLAGTAWLTWRGDSRASSLGPIAVLLFIVSVFAVADVATSQDGRYSFWKMRTVHTLSAQTGQIAVAALGMTVLIIAGGIDLSAGTNIGLSATVLAWVMIRLSSPYLQGDEFAPEHVASGAAPWIAFWIAVAAVAACLATSLAAGALNGILVTQLQVVPFIVTLGTMSIHLGLNKIITEANTIRPKLAVIPEAIADLAKVTSDEGWLLYPLLPLVAPGAWLMLGLAIGVWLVLEYTVVGRHLFAIGSSESTARLCGVNTIFTKTLAYAMAGLFCGIAAIYLFSTTKSGNPSSGPGMELKVIAAVVIGGGSLSGGRGSVIGTLCGAALMPLIELGCSMLELGNQVQDVIIGVIIVGAVALDQVREGKISLLLSVDRARELLYPLGAIGFPLRWPLDQLAEWLRRDEEMK